MTLAATGPALPLWAVVPPCAVMMLVLAGYVLALREADVPASRRRIRTLGSVTMMLTQPLIVYLFAVATPADPRTFVLTWAMLVGLLVLLVALAMLDVVNNTRISANARREFRGELKSLESDVRRMMAPRQSGPIETPREGEDRPGLRLTGDEGDSGEPGG